MLKMGGSFGINTDLRIDPNSIPYHVLTLLLCRNCDNARQHLIIAQLNPSLQTTTRYSGLFHLNDKSLSYLKYLYTSGNTLDNISAKHLIIVKHFI